MPSRNSSESFTCAPTNLRVVKPIGSFPRGLDARAIDEAFRRALAARKTPGPPWLEEHLALGRKIEVSVHYSEWDTGARLSRAASARSARLGLLVELMVGSLAPLLPRPPEDRSYWAIMVARFV